MTLLKTILWNTGIDPNEAPEGGFGHEFGSGFKSLSRSSSRVV
jgi:hypothetical protein